MAILSEYWLTECGLHEEPQPVHWFGMNRIYVTVKPVLTLLHSECPKLHRVLAILGAIVLRDQPRDTKECGCLRQMTPE